MTKQAVILAAGRGSRLGELTEDRPKALLCVGGRSLLAHSIDALAASGIDHVVIVTGYLHAQIEATLGSLGAAMRVQAVQASDYLRAGSMGSLLRATFEVAGPLLLLESDLLYDPAFIAIAQGCGSSTILTADASGSGDEVHVVTTPEGTLATLGKTLSPAEKQNARGELAGISFLSSETLAAFAGLATRWQEEGRVDAHYEHVLLALAQGGHPIAVKHCSDLAWTEIDTPADLHRATTMVWPRIAAAVSARRR
jgi:2-aminoethylphosphonate-pyruvate transaminase